MGQRIQVLFVEDNPDDADLIRLELSHCGFDPDGPRVDTEEAFLDALSDKIDIILSDYAMPHFGGLRALELLNQAGLDIPFILISGTVGEDVAVEIMKHGATDYLLKDRLTRLGPAVRQALQQRRMRDARKKDEVALRESEERFRQLAENIQEVFWLTDPQKGKLLYVSPAFETIWARPLGHLPDSIAGWIETVHPEERERVRAAAQTQQAKGTYDEEYRIIRPDGSIRWIHDRAFPVKNDDGEVYRIVGVARDITDRRRAEEMIHETEKRFSSFMDNLPGVAWIKDSDGHYIFANKQCRDLAMGDREWLGKTDRELWPAELAERYRKNDQKVIEAKAPIQTTETVIQSNGERVSLTSKFPILDREGNPEFICGIGIDITERKRAEEQIHEQAALLEMARDAIIVCDLEGKVRYWNQGAASLYGWTAPQATEQPLIELIYTNGTEQEQVMRTVLEKGGWSGELHHITREKKTVTVNSRWTLLRKQDGTPKSILMISTDITEQKKLEAQFLRAQRLESVGTLASGVAHDLNNILAPIIMCAPVLRNDIPDDTRSRLIDTIETSAKRGADIVKQVLTFARGVEGERLIIDVTHLVNEIAKIAHETFPKSLEIRTRYSGKLWPVQGDPTQLHQILLNLCVNARDAMPDGGELTLSVENTMIDEHYAAMIPEATPGPHICVQVSDTGTGIPQSIIDQIFDPFFTTKEMGKGTGLGLSTVLGIVKSHGGFVNVYSEEGRGSSFKVFLPAGPGPDATTSQSTVQEEPLPSGNGELVLVVDDERSIREAAETILQLHGYRAIIAADGMEAIALFAEHSGEIRAVITDMMMPHMDGMTLIRTLRKMQPNIPIIASTGRTDDKRLNQLKSLDVPVCLTKPYDKKKLLNTLEQALTKSAAEPVYDSTPAAEPEPEPSQATKNVRVMIVEDDMEWMHSVDHLLKKNGYTTALAGDGRMALRLADSFHPQVIITDIFMPEKDGFELIVELRRRQSKAKIIAFSAGSRAGFTITQLAEVLRTFEISGFLQKPFTEDELLQVIEKAYPG